MGKSKRLWSDVFDECFKRAQGHPPDWEAMPPRERLAVSLGLLYTQIKRNGFQFWIINGFAESHTDEVLSQLDALATDTASAVRDVVAEVAELGERALWLEAFSSEDDDSSQQELDGIATRCSELDHRLYEIGDALMEEVDARLTTM